MNKLNKQTITLSPCYRQSSFTLLAFDCWISIQQPKPNKPQQTSTNKLSQLAIVCMHGTVMHTRNDRRFAEQY
jgi:hypothetical protein